MRKRTIQLLFVIPMILALCAGCSRYRPRSVDIAKGEYYEDTEYRKLSKADRDAYCKALAEELGRLQERSKSAQEELAKDKDRVKVLTKELRDAERQYATYTAEIDELSRQLSDLAQLPKNWVLSYGECLWTVAGRQEVYSDPLKWPRIWRANKELIEDPDWVLAGWELKIPREWPYRYTVNQDEWLGKIAGYWEIYNDYRKWPVIYEANRDRIRDPDLIFPRQELLIPRPDTLQ